MTDGSSLSQRYRPPLKTQEAAGVKTSVRPLAGGVQVEEMRTGTCKSSISSAGIVRDVQMVCVDFSDSGPPSTGIQSKH